MFVQFIAVLSGGIPVHWYDFSYKVHYCILQILDLFVLHCVYSSVESRSELMFIIVLS